MDWKQFFASVIGSIAWPSALVAILFIFRVQIRKLISQIRRVTAAGVDVELSEQVENVVTAGQAVEAEQHLSLPKTTTLDPALLELAKNFPSAAFLQSFKQLEGLILKIRSRLPDERPHRTLNEVIHQLRIKGHISGSVEELFFQLRKTRNAVAHVAEEEMSSCEAIELISQVKLLENLLETVLDQLPQPKSRI